MGDMRFCPYGDILSLSEIALVEPLLSEKSKPEELEGLT